MNTKTIKLLKDWGKFASEAVLEVDEKTAGELIESKTAVLYDEEAEQKAKEQREADEARLVSVIKAAVAEAVKKPDEKAAGVQAASVHERSDDDPKGGFKSLGEFAIAVKDFPSARDQRIIKAAGTGFIEGVDSDGGFLVPTEFSTQLLQKATETSAVASRATGVPMTTNAIKIPYVKESSRADGSRQGGIRGYWASELGSMSSSKSSFGQVGLNLNKCYVFVYGSDELIEDAAALGSMINTMAANELAFKLDDGVINGTGVGMPVGIMNAPCLVTVAKEAGQGADTIVAENIIKMWSRCYGPSRANAVWFINQDIEPQLYTMALPVGTAGVPVYMPANGLAGAPYGTLFGRPVVPIEYCNTLGDKGDIILGDLSQYLLGRKTNGVTADVSIHLKFDYDQTTFRFTMRADGQPWWASALTTKNGSASTTLSPFVTLAERA